jgi:hypothetical protein
VILANLSLQLGDTPNPFFSNGNSRLCGTTKIRDHGANRASTSCAALAFRCIRADIRLDFSIETD